VSGFASHDVRGHGAGAGGVVELHVQFLSGAVDWASGKDPAFVAYDQFLSTGISLSRGEVRGSQCPSAMSGSRSGFAESGHGSAMRRMAADGKA
jgi:hypothetical protein